MPRFSYNSEPSKKKTVYSSSKSVPIVNIYTQNTIVNPCTVVIDSACNAHRQIEKNIEEIENSESSMRFIKMLQNQSFNNR